MMIGMIFIIRSDGLTVIGENKLCMMWFQTALGRLKLFLMEESMAL